MSSDVKFIRVNGRVVPIRGKGPSKAKKQRNYDKYGDGANQAARIEAKYSKKANKGTAAYGVAAAAGVGVAVFSRNKYAIAGGAAIAAAAAILGHRKARKNKRSLESAKQREYFGAFGTDSQGNKPTRRRPK